MKRAVLLLSVGIAAMLLLGLVTNAFATIGTYERFADIQYTGAGTDRGFAVNSNPNSPYHGYIYACDGTANSRVIRILRPDPAEAGVTATSYAEVGTITNPVSTIPPTGGGDVIMSCFVGPDDKVYGADYHGKAIIVGDATGGMATALPITPAVNPRGVWVVGNYGQIGTKIYVAEAAAGGASRCEVFEYTGTAWNKVFDLDPTTVGGKFPYTVAVDKAGNSYWLSCSNGDGISGFKYVIKVKADYTVDSAWSLQIPSGFNTDSTGAFSPTMIGTSIAYVDDKYDVDNSEFIAIAFYGVNAGAHGNCVLRFRTDGSYIDGFGMHYWLIDYGTRVACWQSTSPSYWPMELWDPPTGNRNMWMAADDMHNFYVLTEPVSVTNDDHPGIAKFHRTLQAPAAAPTDLAASHDIYGQVRLSWQNHSMNGGLHPAEGGAETCNIYRSTTTTKPATPYNTVADGYTKWKDSDQGQTAGGPFYYWVTENNAYGESAPIGPIGPVAPIAPTAPAARSLNAALSHSEISALDTVECPDLDGYIDSVKKFLDTRNVSYTEIWDADSTKLNIENDDIAGHTLLILPINLHMTSYTAQCIKDYVKYNGGRVWSGYFNSDSYGTGVYPGECILKDIYRFSRVGGGWDWDTATPWYTQKYRVMKPVAGAPGADVLFAGLPNGVTNANKNAFSFIVTPLNDGSAKVVATLSSVDGTNKPTNDAAIVLGYVGTDVRSLWTGILYWEQNLETNGFYSGTKFLENCLTFWGIPFTSNIKYHGIGQSQLSYGDGSTAGYQDAVVTMQLKDISSGTNYVYLEDQNRSAGIKAIIPAFVDPQDFAPGQLLTVSGKLGSESETVDGKTVWGDRTLDCYEVSVGGVVDPLKPLYMKNFSVTGSWAGGGYQNGVGDGIGLNNLGLYVRVSGKVTYATGPDGYSLSYFYIDDGSNVKDGTQHMEGYDAVDNIGIRVIVPYWDSFMPDGFAVGKNVSVTGCTAIGLAGVALDNGVRAIRIPGVSTSVTINN